jgi:hypothetical protein
VLNREELAGNETISDHPHTKDVWHMQDLEDIRSLKIALGLILSS